MPDYNNTVIYGIYCDDEDVNEIYVGSTCDYQHRILNHRSSCHNAIGKSYNLKIYQYIREHGGFDCFKTEILEEYPCDSKHEKEERERFWIEKLGSKLNTFIPTRDMKEWYEQNREKLLEQVKEYREENKDKIAERKKEYYEENRDKLLEKKKEYREQNRDKIAERMKEYREKNREKIAEQRKEKYTCECGSIIRFDTKLRHERTKKHQTYVEKQN